MLDQEEIKKDFIEWAESVGYTEDQHMPYEVYLSYHKTPQYEKMMNSIEDWGLKLKMAVMEHSEYWLEKLHKEFSQEQAYFHMAIIAEMQLEKAREFNKKVIEKENALMKANTDAVQN